MAKKTIELEYEGVEYINKNGDKATADFRHLDAKEAWEASQEANEEGGGDSKPVRVYRVSRLGERLIARFKGSRAAADAAEFAAEANEVYGKRGFYKAVVK